MAILNETSDCAPALASFKGRLFIAWKGKGNYHLNVMSSRDGTNWHNKKVFVNENTFFEPALAVFKGRLYLAWTSIDDPPQLNLMTTTDGVNWSDPHPIDEYSRYGPALCAFQDRLCVAWTGIDHLSQLNLLSSADGATWDLLDKVTLPENSSATPALATVADPKANPPADNVLYLGWSGTDYLNHLNLIRSTDGRRFEQKIIFNPDSLNGQNARSLEGPTLSVKGSNGSSPSLLITWTEREHDGHLRNLEYPRPNQDTNSEIDETIVNLADTSIAAPASTQFGSDGIYVAWIATDEDQHLNVANLDDMEPQ